MREPVGKAEMGREKRDCEHKKSFRVLRITEEVGKMNRLSAGVLELQADNHRFEKVLPAFIKEIFG